MHALFPALLALSSLNSHSASELSPLDGAGSSAAAPVYRAWAQAYARSTAFELRYDPAGSSEGVKRIRAGQTDFGATDVPPAAQTLAEDRLVLVPMFVSGAVPVVNLPKWNGAPLRLSGELLAQIFMGTLQRWNAPALQALNPGVPLPDLPIKPVVRSDGSGTTYYFSSYLSNVSAAWKQEYGSKSSFSWPAHALGAKGSDGVVERVKETPGSIGYVDFNYVVRHKLQAVSLRNAQGEFVQAGAAGFKAALQASDWARKSDFHAPLVNLPGPQTWPITMGTFVLLPKVAPAPERTQRALHFFVWALLRGDQTLEGLSFVRLPDGLQAAAFRALSGVTDRKGQALGLDAVSKTLEKP